MCVGKEGRRVITKGYTNTGRIRVQLTFHAVIFEVKMFLEFVLLKFLYKTVLDVKKN